MMLREVLGRMWCAAASERGRLNESGRDGRVATRRKRLAGGGRGVGMAVASLFGGSSFVSFVGSETG